MDLGVAGSPRGIACAVAETRIALKHKGPAVHEIFEGISTSCECSRITNIVYHQTIKPSRLLMCDLSHGMNSIGANPSCVISQSSDGRRPDTKLCSPTCTMRIPICCDSRRDASFAAAFGSRRVGRSRSVNQYCVAALDASSMNPRLLQRGASQNARLQLALSMRLITPIRRSGSDRSLIDQCHSHPALAAGRTTSRIKAKAPSLGYGQGILALKYWTVSQFWNTFCTASASEIARGRRNKFCVENMGAHIRPSREIVS